MFGKLIIEPGFFHAFRNIEASKKRVDEIKRKYKISSKIFKAIIPKGTIFYEGQFEDICSKSLMIVEEI